MEIGRIRGKAMEKLRDFWRQSRESENDYWVSRFLILRVLGLTYFAAFLSLILQFDYLLGSNGLTPVQDAVPAFSWERFLELPTVFYFNQSDAFMLSLAAIGVLISFLVLIGFANVPILIYNWFIYLSFVNVGQVWYGYGWEIQLVETGFLAIFFAPLIDPRPFRENYAPPEPIIWLFRWLAFRIYIGSGLIKLRGVQCWEKLTCLDRFFQTQPIPNPISPWMHYLPSPIQKIGVLYTHFVQLLMPFTAMLENRGRQIRNWGGVLMISLQIVLILTGNFAFLNWLTIVPVIAMLDDRFILQRLPETVSEKLVQMIPENGSISDLRHAANILIALLVIVLSVPVVVNLASQNQAMNTSFNNWNVVNTYGAFGSIREKRTEIVLEGTSSENLSDPTWREYDFRHKPDQENDPLTQVAPYQPRIAWQMWFASFSEPGREPWLLHLSYKLLHNDPTGLKAVKENPFPEEPPEYIRAKIYRFEMQPPLEENTWEREELGTWMPPINQDNERLERYIERRWADQSEKTAG
jgi:hypothetical protein